MESWKWQYEVLQILQVRVEQRPFQGHVVLWVILGHQFRLSIKHCRKTWAVEKMLSRRLAKEAFQHEYRWRTDHVCFCNKDSVGLHFPTALSLPASPHHTHWTTTSLSYGLCTQLCIYCRLSCWGYSALTHTFDAYMKEVIGFILQENRLTWSAATASCIASTAGPVHSTVRGDQYPPSTVPDLGLKAYRYRDDLTEIIM